MIYVKRLRLPAPWCHRRCRVRGGAVGGSGVTVGAMNPWEPAWEKNRPPRRGWASDNARGAPSRRRNTRGPQAIEQAEGPRTTGALFPGKLPRSRRCSSRVFHACSTQRRQVAGGRQALHRHGVHRGADAREGGERTGVRDRRGPRDHHIPIDDSSLATKRTSFIATSNRTTSSCVVGGSPPPYSWTSGCPSTSRRARPRRRAVRTSGIDSSSCRSCTREMATSVIPDRTSRASSACSSTC